MSFKRLLVISAFFATACSSQTGGPSRLTVKKSDTGIVGGTEVAANSESSKLAVLVRGTHVVGDQYYYSICTGSFIADDIVVTAAHCFGDKDKTYQIVLENSLPEIGAVERVLDVESVAIPDSFAKNELNSDGVRDDIALVKTKQKKPADYVTLGRLPKLEMQDGMTIKAIGYGRTVGVQDTGGTGQGSGVLRETNIGVIAVENSILLVDQTTGHGICQGDSGGPGIVKKDGKFYIVGTTVANIDLENDITQEAQDPKFDVCKRQGLYLNVSHYNSWIDATIKSLHETPAEQQKANTQPATVDGGAVATQETI